MLGSMTRITCIDVDQITNAAHNIAGLAVKTPILNHPDLDRLAGARIYLKLENLQRTGSFKFRGAYNKLAQLNSSPGHPVVAWSSGNHAQGVACAAQLRQQPAHIVMPADAPGIKLANTASYGASVVTYDRYHENREEIGQQLAKDLGADIIPPYDDYDVMAGQGTCGLEFVEQCRADNIHLDAVLTCCGGGGLTAGVASAFHHLSSDTAIIAVEPEHFDDHVKSMQAGKRVINAAGPNSICDALLAPTPGELTFPINQNLLAGILSVSDDEIRATLKFAFEKLKLVIEPGGAAALAAVLHHKIKGHNEHIGVIVTGGNADPDQFSNYIL